MIETLKGLITDFKPVLAAEVLKKLNYEERKALYDLITGLGYSVYLLDESKSNMIGTKINMDNLTNKKSYDIICFPKDTHALSFLFAFIFLTHATIFMKLGVT